jgi:D-aminopeptidase
MRNCLTDIADIHVGHAEDRQAQTGATAIIFDKPTLATADIRGGGPGTRDIALLSPENTVEHIDALFLSGGSAFGLDTGGGVQAWLAEQGRGFAVGPASANVRVPIVPGAILFDLLNGGDKGPGAAMDYRALGYAAAQAAVNNLPRLGSAGAGLGATTASLRGGLGTASSTLPGSVKVAALAVVNAAGSATCGATHHFWAAPFERHREFGGHGLPEIWPEDALKPRMKGAPQDAPGQATTLCVVATDANLSLNEAKRLAIMAQDGMARALYPVHTPLDGDIVFAVATAEKPLCSDAQTRHHALAVLGAEAANCVARAIARGVYEAEPSPEGSPMPLSYKQQFV